MPIPKPCKKGNPTRLQFPEASPYRQRSLDCLFVSDARTVRLPTAGWREQATACARTRYAHGFKDVKTDAMANPARVVCNGSSDKAKKTR
jgi:hypothetical protein